MYATPRDAALASQSIQERASPKSRSCIGPGTRRPEYGDGSTPVGLSCLVSWAAGLRDSSAGKVAPYLFHFLGCRRQEDIMSGLMEYNGSTIVAMAGDKCVGIASDSRYGIRQLQTVSCNRQKCFQVTDQCYVGLAGLATDVQTMSQLLNFRMKLFSLREERVMQPKMIGNMLASMLYEKRFGPWFTEPVVAGLDKDHNPFLCGFDFIGCLSTAEDFVVSGTTSDQLFGVCESFWRPGMNKDELFETLSQCLLSGVDRDCLAGWGGVVHIITPDEIITKKLKGRMD
eukprot:s845_g12.t1